jgi:hypothetical protein
MPSKSTRHYKTGTEPEKIEEKSITTRAQKAGDCRSTRKLAARAKSSNLSFLSVYATRRSRNKEKTSRLELFFKFRFLPQVTVAEKSTHREDGGHDSVEVRWQQEQEAKKIQQGIPHA